MPKPYSAVPRFPSTFQSLLAAAIFLATIPVFIQSCRKMDRVAFSSTLSQTENKFFNQHRSADAREKTLVHFLKRRNDSSHFVEKTVERIGYPRWDKAILVSKSNTIANRAGNNGDSTAFIYIPFARENENYVNAVMQVKATSADTSFSYVCDWQYKETLSSSVADTSYNALKYFMFFAGHDNRVFGHTRFRLKDNRILQPVSDTLVTANKQYMLELAGTNGNQNELMVAPDPELPHSSCLMVYDMINAGYVVEYYKVGKVCVLESYYLPVPSGGGGGAGNGGGDPSGDDPPPCGNTDPGLSGKIYDPCDTGWDPIPIDDPPPQSEPVDSMLNRYARRINKIADSVFALSQGSIVEWGFIIVKNAAGEIYAKNAKTDNDPESVQQDKTLLPGEVIIGELHTHPASGNNPLDRSAVSGGDFQTLKINSRDRYTCFVDCGNVRYAIVVEDIYKSRSFFLKNTPSSLHQLQYAAAYYGSANWQNATETAIVQLSPYTTSGIGIYKSDITKTKFTRIN